ncbi:hypothetical protein LP420_07890 [Massilia sp. B-10]|nr:hypothetical protein LP420_07890 [Massilia sp. B-10]
MRGAVLAATGATGAAARWRAACNWSWSALLLPAAARPAPRRTGTAAARRLPRPRYGGPVRCSVRCTPGAEKSI